MYGPALVNVLILLYYNLHIDFVMFSDETFYTQSQIMVEKVPFVMIFINIEN